MFKGICLLKIYCIHLSMCSTLHGYYFYCKKPQVNFHHCVVSFKHAEAGFMIIIRCFRRPKQSIKIKLLNIKLPTIKWINPWHIFYYYSLNCFKGLRPGYALIRECSHWIGYNYNWILFRSSATKTLFTIMNF